MSEQLYQIVHLQVTENDTWIQSETDYPPMTKDKAWSIVTELTNDAFDESSEPGIRWILVQKI